MTDATYLGLGSNLGDRLGSLQRATDLLGALPGVRVIASSRVWESAAVGGPSQPDYLNAVLRVRTTLTPGELLSACAGVEARLGRVRDVRWGPRIIDVDVLLIDAVTVHDPVLIVPHPRLRERAFVVLPLLELDPDASLPDGTRLVDVRLGSVAAGTRPYAPPLVVSP